MKRFLLLTIMTLSLSIPPATAQDVADPTGDELITDDAYHEQTVKAPRFKKSDSNGDGIISPADKAGWRNNKALDSNNDEKVEAAEYNASYLTPKNAEVVHRNVVYKTVGDKKCLIDVYLPKIESGQTVPVVFFTHGGGWAAGTKDLNPQLVDLFDHLLEKGIACASASYRLVKNRNPNDEATMLTCVADCMDGMRFLAKQHETFHVDTSKIIPFGNSAGGHIALMLTYAPTADFKGDEALSSIDVQPVAGMSWYGPVDFTDSDLFVADVEGFDKMPDRFTGRMKKGIESTSYQDASPEVKELMEKLSPIRYLTKDSPPMLTMHGNLDTTIPQKHSRLLAAKAKEIGADVEFLPVNNAGHGWRGNCDPDWPTIRDRMVEFVVEETR